MDLLGIILLIDEIKFIFKNFGGFCHVILSTKMQNKALIFKLFSLSLLEQSCMSLDFLCFNSSFIK